MKEKIAQALRMASGQSYEAQADAVLDALMEPTEGMVEAGWDELHHPTATYCAMIQAAKEGK